MAAPNNERATWIRHSFLFALVTFGFHVLQFVASGVLWRVTGSSALAVFGLDAIVSAFAAMLLAIRIRRSFETLGDNWRSRGVAVGYLVAAALGFAVSVFQLWTRRWSPPSFLILG